MVSKSNISENSISAMQWPTSRKEYLSIRLQLKQMVYVNWMKRACCLYVIYIYSLIYSLCNINMYLSTLYHKVTKLLLSVDYWRFFVPKFVDIEPGLLELFEYVTGVRFFWDTVYKQMVINVATWRCNYCRLPIGSHAMEWFLSLRRQ